VSSSGHRRTTVLAEASSAAFLVYVSALAVPPLIPVFVHDVGLTYAQAGSLMSAYAIAFALSSLGAVLLLRRIGMAYLVGGGLVLCGAATVGFAATTSFPLLLGCRALIGVAAALVYAPGLSLVLSLAASDRAHRTASWFLCSLYAATATTLLVTPILAAEVGWQSTLRLYGLVCLPVGAAILLRARRGAPVPRRAAPPLRTMLLNPRFVLVLAALFLIMFVLYGVSTWMPPLLVDSGFGSTSVGVASMLMALAGIPAALVAGWFADRRPLLVITASFILSAVLLPWPERDPSSLLAITILGIAIALVTNAAVGPLSTLSSITLRSDGATGASIGTFVGMLGALSSTFLGGYLVGVTESYRATFVLFGVAAAVAGVIVMPVLAMVMRRPVHELRGFS
jgi:DHA1 family chloramphenicol resistance protein-like MFS transporter